MTPQDIKTTDMTLRVNDPMPTVEDVKKHLEGLPEGAKVEIKEPEFIKNTLKSTEKAGEFTITAAVTIDGVETYYYIKVKVEAIKPIELKVGDMIPSEEEVKKHLDFLPKDAEVYIMENLKNTNTPGEFEIKVTVYIGEKQIDYTIPVVVKPKEEPQPEKPEPEQPKDTTVYNLPVIKVTNPDYYAAFSEEKGKNVHVQGNVTHVNDLEKLTLTITKKVNKLKELKFKKSNPKKKEIAISHLITN